MNLKKKNNEKKNQGQRITARTTKEITTIKQRKVGEANDKFYI